MQKGMRVRQRFAVADILLTLAIAATFSACNSPSASVHSYTKEPFPQQLSDWHLFNGKQSKLRPNSGVVPYDLNTPLFSDYADKYRFVWMPPGTSATYREDGPFDFPVGTILAKSFAFPAGESGQEKLIETRLLVHAESGWVGLPYVWDEKQKEALLQLVPDPVEVAWSDATGQAHKFTYSIPNVNECKQCHERDRVMFPIGPKARNLNKNYSYVEGPENQLEHWVKVGYLKNVPALDAVPRAAKWDDPSSGTLEDRARAYLDNNCAHCHQPGGSAGYTGVDFRLTQTEISRFGACKTPGSAGQIADLTYDLVPGRPDASILIYRLESTAPKVMMPALGRAVRHEEGLALLKAWIKSLPEEKCAR